MSVLGVAILDNSSAGPEVLVKITQIVWVSDYVFKILKVL
jgi:hypothetical protein